MRKNTLRNMTLCAMFAVLIAAGAFMRIPMPLVPITLQYLFTMLAGLLLGGKWGAAAVCVYMALGLAGLPVFTQGGGIGYVLQPSFGYIIGFAVGTYVTGTLAWRKEKPGFGYLFAASLLGLGIIYLFGLIYYSLISHVVLKTSIGLWPLFVHGCLLTLPGDIALSVLGAILGRRLIPQLRQKERQAA